MEPDRASVGDASSRPRTAPRTSTRTPPAATCPRCPDGTIARVNETFLRWTGHRRDELVGRRRFADLLSAGGRIYHETHYAPLLRMQGSVREIALEVVCADGSRLPVLVNSALKRDAAGNPLLIRTTLIDATERKSYERELLRARDRERAARERIEQLQRITAVLAGALAPDEIGAGIVRGARRERRRVERASSPCATRTTTGSRSIARRGRRDQPAGSWLDAAGRRGQRGARSRSSPASRSSAKAARRAGALAALPLTVEHARARAAAGSSFPAARELTAEDRAFLVACAGQCSQALERARLHERTARGRAEIGVPRASEPRARRGAGVLRARATPAGAPRRARRRPAPGSSCATTTGARRGRGGRPRGHAGGRAARAAA